MDVKEKARQIKKGLALFGKGLPAEEALEVPMLYEEWQPGLDYKVNDIVRFGETDLYKVLQAHKSQADWPPDRTPALFKKISLPGVISAWVQPQGAHDAYKKGDVVTHKGKTWQSTVDNNVWEPGVYGWVEK